MTITNFLLILAILEVVTPLATQGIKQLLTSLKVNYASNIVVLIVAVALSGLVGAFYYVSTKTTFGAVDVFYIIFLASTNWLGSMLGYDKVIQAIKQIGGADNE